MDVARNFVRSTNLRPAYASRAGRLDQNLQMFIPGVLECPRDWLEQISKILNVV